jgi:DNA-binding NtrC family response regulator
MATFLPFDAFPSRDGVELGAASDLRSRVLAYERGLIAAALAETSGNQRRAARLLGILPTTLHEKIKRFGLQAPGPAAEAGPPGDTGT